MSHYAIGDVQGCYDALRRLLDKIQFSPEKDTLWFTGDLVNRGPQSLKALRFIKSLGAKHRVVLGNHDLHLLAVAAGAHPGWKEDTLQDILQADDREALLSWLKTLPLLHHDENLNYVMVHAGLAPSWDLKTAKALSLEVSNILQSDSSAIFLKEMYGDTPDQWSDHLTGWNRLRCITNFFTRVRFCDANGRIDLSNKSDDSHRKDWLPWFKIPDRRSEDCRILFGHWAALAGVTNTANVYALDTGCVWGYCLTAMRLDDEMRVNVDCQ